LEAPLLGNAKSIYIFFGDVIVSCMTAGLGFKMSASNSNGSFVMLLGRHDTRALILSEIYRGSESQKKKTQAQKLKNSRGRIGLRCNKEKVESNCDASVSKFISSSTM